MRIVGPWRTRLVGFGAAAVFGLLVLLFGPQWLSATARVVAAYDAAALAVLLVIWRFAMHSDPKQTQKRAEVEDPGRNVALIVALSSVIAGLFSAIRILGTGPRAPTPDEQHVAYAVALAGVVLGWLLIHTVFALRYAHMFYFDSDEDTQADRGLVFPGTEDPSDQDFAYFSFVVGMTFQVSDVQVTDRGVRRVVLLHGLLSFAYNTVILAFGINVLAGLIKH